MNIQNGMASNRELEDTGGVNRKDGSSELAREFNVMDCGISAATDGGQPVGNALKITRN